MMPELFMIDLDALRKSRRVTWKLARQNLALLDHLLLAAQQPDRPLSVPESLSAKSDRSRRPTCGGSPRRSKTRRVSGPSGSGGDGAGGAGRRTSTSRSIPAARRGAWPRATSIPAEIQPLLDDPDLPFRRAGDDVS